MGRRSGWLLVAGSAVVLAPLAGHWIAPFDSLAIILPYAAATLVMLALILRRALGMLRLLAALSAVVGMIPVALLLRPDPAPRGAELRLLQHNIYFLNDGRLLPDILPGYDVAAFQETQSLWVALRSLPSPWVGMDCPYAPGIGTALATHLPLTATGCLAEGEAWIRVLLPDGSEVTILSMHLEWPWPADGLRQARQVDRLAAEIAALPRPLVVAGDFNQMPWSAAVQDIARAADGRVTSGIRATFVKKDGLVRFPIDHVIIPEGWGATTTKEDLYGSDHNAVAARIVIPR